jgi:hypothetical protein
VPPASVALFGLQLTLPLEDLGLRHHDAADCPCQGQHPATLPIDLAEHGLHRDADCEPELDGRDLDALQRLHELTHPDGVVFVENCRDPDCERMFGAVGR